MFSIKHKWPIETKYSESILISPIETVVAFVGDNIPSLPELSGKTWGLCQLQLPSCPLSDDPHSNCISHVIKSIMAQRRTVREALNTRGFPGTTSTTVASPDSRNFGPSSSFFSE